MCVAFNTKRLSIALPTMGFDFDNATDEEVQAKSREKASKAFRSGVDIRAFNRHVRRKYGYSKLYLIGGEKKIAHIKGFGDIKRWRRREATYSILPTNPPTTPLPPLPSEQEQRAEVEYLLLKLAKRKKYV